MNSEKLSKLVESLKYHKPTEEVQAKIEKLRELGIAYVSAVAELIPDNRDVSLFVTHFEDTQQRAIRSIVVPQ